MKKYIFSFLMAILWISTSAQIMTEKEINKMAREMSENLAGTKVMNSEIIINRIYSSKRDFVTVYDVPQYIELSEQELKRERIEQLKAFGGETFYKNKINLELWFMKNNKLYKRVRIEYFELKS